MPAPLIGFIAYECIVSDPLRTSTSPLFRPMTSSSSSNQKNARTLLKTLLRPFKFSYDTLQLRPEADGRRLPPEADGRRLPPAGFRTDGVRGV